MKKYILLCLPLSLSTACTSSTGVIMDGQSSFRVMHSGDTGFTNSNTLQKNAYKEASSFCAQKNEIVKTINMESKQSRPLGGWPEASLLFECVKREKNK